MSIYEFEKAVKCKSAIEDAGGVTKVRSPRASVIVPTYHDWARLKLCVNALKNQTFPQDDFEVIIVNNAPEDTPPVDFSLPHNFCIIKEGKPGSYAARNAALKLAKGEIIAFTDSDCIPDPYWLEAAVNHFDKGVERIAGKIELFFKSDKLTLVEIYEKAFAFDQEKYAQTGGAATANMITLAKHFETVGLFNDTLMSGGDNEWGWRAKDKGISIEYAPDVIVNHPARADMKAMLKKRKRVIGGEVCNKNNASKNTFFLILLKGYFPPRRQLNIFGRKGLSFSRKFLAYLLCYYFKIYSTTYKLALLIGIAKPERS
ncbi:MULTISPECIES: glycosyltransferase [Halomonadaceae]|jgi:GT2 family glycosyltransferase|uniref:Glycosyl transferase, family 2 n=1 Tax=Vreelandella titanicae BH1 TaxID=1204738 RepID=L9UBI5_9GAMM|nr:MULTISPECIES: glycosyltransferase [Halomonas]QGQ70378.1 glycosyltransferase [Halomonas sp. PA16-9]UEQ06180.1 glycosyltransferase [Halomonas profundus]ELY22249.1 Glycosyl transferase, family 2 [Halomonas titanicae BH1]NVE89757.1 glycosyltransferase [Halomonas titanicae]PKH59761.1 glycosyltransferase family 2 protein [Halomonas sp. Choline-3u-9]|tara:strand:- start:1931 stop:2878 length:948 start_codon:yes stop_codon:yes gene_type:complete